MAQAELFHLIADRDCAEVRKFLVENSLQGQISFRNCHYESHAEALLKLTGKKDVPVLYVFENEKIVDGKEAILAFLRSVPWPKL